MKQLAFFISAVLAGGMIGVGCAVYLGSGRTPVGAVLFAVGLYTICVYGMELFTGRVGYLVQNPPSYLGALAGVWLGNLTGTVLCGLLLRHAQPVLGASAAQLTAAKLAQEPAQTFALALFCGMLMFVAVDSYRQGAGTARFFGVFLCVPTFILAGFEHVVADMAYFAMGMTAEQLAQGARFLLICTIGNAAGACLIPLWKKMQTHGISA